MARKLTRLYQPDQMTTARGGSNSATIVYRAYDDTGVGVTKEETYFAIPWLGLGLPRLGDNHPFLGSSAIAQSMTRQQDGNSVLITVSYAPVSGGSTQRPIVDILDGTFTSLELSSQDVLVEIPSFRLNKLQFQDENNGDVAPVFVWEKTDSPFQVEINRHTFTVLLSGEDIGGTSVAGLFAAFSRIRAQQNTLHTFGSDQYLFKPRFLKQRTKATDGAAGQLPEPARWEVQYTWLFDPGVRNTYGPGGTPGANQNGLHFRPSSTVAGFPFFSQAYVCQDEEFAIRPYQRVVTYPNSSELNPSAPPIVDFITPYRSEPGGWQDLPGIG